VISKSDVLLNKSPVTRTARMGSRALHRATLFKKEGFSCGFFTLI